jgi:hypothetical protein
MNRWLASGMAFAIGLSGSFAVVSASEDQPGRRNGDLLGPIDFPQYCEDEYGPGAVAVGDSSNAFGWTCASRKNGIFRTDTISDQEEFDQICEAQFGSPAFAQSYNSSIPDSWQCFSGRRIP